MSKKRETLLKEKVRPLLEKIPQSVWIKTQMKSLRGVPDFMGCIRGRSICLELKTDDGVVDALQVWRLRKWKNAGAYTSVLAPNNLQAVLNELYSL
jgi:hypothetical protein